MTIPAITMRKTGLALVGAAVLAALAPWMSGTASAWSGGQPSQTATQSCPTTLQGLGPIGRQALGSFYAAQPANGSTSVANGVLQLAGTNQTINVFSVAASSLTMIHALSISAPSGSAVLVDVAGIDDSFAGIGVTLHGVVASHVIYNFYQAQTLRFADVDLQGSVLAGWARVTLGSNVLYGTLIAASVTTPVAGSQAPANQTSGEVFNLCLYSQQYHQPANQQQNQQGNTQQQGNANQQSGNQQNAGQQNNQQQNNQRQQNQQPRQSNQQQQQSQRLYLLVNRHRHHYQQTLHGRRQRQDDRRDRGHGDDRDRK